MAKRATRTRASEVSAQPEFNQPPDTASDIRSNSMGSEPSDEDIRLRAYHRYLERGGGHGADFDDWLDAERELRNRNRA